MNPTAELTRKNRDLEELNELLVAARRDLTDQVQELRERLLAFMDEHVYPAEADYDRLRERLTGC